jgi:hypothetical protein
VSENAQEYRTPAETLSYLHSTDTDHHGYTVATSYLFNYMEDDVRFSDVESVRVTRHLIEGRTQEAEDIVNEVLDR